MRNGSRNVAAHCAFPRSPEILRRPIRHRMLAARKDRRHETSAEAFLFSAVTQALRGVA
jgi:hypothetical protein